MGCNGNCETCGGCCGGSCGGCGNSLEITELELNLLQTLNGYTFLSGVFGEEGNENSEEFILIPLQNHDKKISHIFELGYIAKKVTRLDNISLTYIDTIRRILHIAGFTC